MIIFNLWLNYATLERMHDTHTSSQPLPKNGKDPYRIQGAKYVWRIPQTDMQLVAQVAAAHNLSLPIAQTLIARGFDTQEAINTFLFSSFERDVMWAGILKDAQKAVDRILMAIERQEPILICGDYDVDGITSSAMMMASLLPLGAKINFFLPHRVKDGYGLSTHTIERAARSGYKVVVTVDNGITALEPARRAKELGIDLIITDHHRPQAELPDAFAIVNPNQLDCPYPFKVLAGVGVSFKVLSLLYERKGLILPPKVYELLLLGTVADVVPLIGENRFWVRHGLQYVNRIESLSFKVLKQNGKLLELPRIASTDIGFSIAPQINALGRLEDARQAVRFLIGADAQEVQQVGNVLLELNDARKEIERSIVADVMGRIEKGAIDLSRDKAIIDVGESWPPGVIGLVASRIVGAYGRPTLLFHATKDGILKGSCRSISEFSIFDALTDARDLLIQFGGHSQAAGLSLHRTHLPELKHRIDARIDAMLTQDDLKLKITVDGRAQLSDLSKKFIDDLALLEPFGHANPSPHFIFERVVQVQQPVILKDAHVKCRIFADGVVKPIIFFNRPELFDLLQRIGDNPFHVVAQVRENHWNGKSTIELTGTDIAYEEFIV